MFLPTPASFLTIILFINISLAYTPLSDATLHLLPAAGADFDIHTGALLAPLLITRVPGTPGSLKAQHHFLDFFAASLPNWTVEYQNSTGKTPATGETLVPFANIIAYRDPPWAQKGDVGRLTLVAHYDSKLTPKGFIGATDSAAPCAMIMHAARSVDAALTSKWEAMRKAGEDGVGEEQGLQILFLDGEEAFVNWSDEDSLYGARSLAETWEAQPHPAMSVYKTALSSITLFMLLDLLGSASPRVPSFFKTTHWAYQHLANCEKRLRDLNILQSKPTQGIFLPDGDKDPDRIIGGMVEDDHIPFLARGVEILHVIPLPFPAVWHTSNDDGEHLDGATVEDWARITTAFVAEWMDLEGHFEPQKSRRDDVVKSELIRQT